MQPDDLKAALKAWGHATVNRYALCRAERTTHQLDKAREHAPGTRERALRALVGRDGEDRRRSMAKAAGVRGMHIVPKWACEPIRATADDRVVNNPEIAVDMGIPDELLWLERAVSQMERQFPLRARILRTEFTVAAGQATKARMVQEGYGGSLTLRQYRYELQRALDWLAGARIAA